MPNALQEMSKRYLETLYELSEGGLHPEVEAHTVISQAGLSQEEARPVHRYLESKDLISWQCRVPCVRITTRGIDAIQNSYEYREALVLKSIYDLSQQNTSKPVFLHELESQLTLLDARMITGLCKGLDEQGFVEWPDDVDSYLYITRRGIEAINSQSKQKTNSGGDVYHTHIGTIHGAAHIGPGGIQNVQINNQPVSEILPQLSSFIEAIKKESFDDKDDVIKDLEVALEVARSNPDAKAGDSVWKRIQTKLTAAKTTMEIAGLAYASYPHWPAVWEFFFGK